MFHQQRPVHRNTQQMDQRGSNFRQGRGSYMFQQRQHHGYHERHQLNRNNEINGRQDDESHFFHSHGPAEFGEEFHSHFGKGPKGYQRQDARIYEDLCEHLEHDHHIDASLIEVDVKNGVVTLTGQVENRVMKWRTEDLAESIPGVKDVDCQINVKPLWKKMFRSERASQE